MLNRHAYSNGYGMPFYSGSGVENYNYNSNGTSGLNFEQDFASRYGTGKGQEFGFAIYTEPAIYTEHVLILLVASGNGHGGGGSGTLYPAQFFVEDAW